ncbi:cell filamentation protein Fic [Candidatus Peribacteria bacterium RIFCSPLOWO2_12_FULL_55_15]|nr:MAG: cell filamentation protein Fic [Candidatus Peribacteria bacterium RIFCSPHIGHO2_01_FULL_54_22]OGJ62322.1 MAG: cell filamentation protein Fic [Candidatus Peribacteria bacterium RIFCSPHIGHO2_02_FULL_55_24]OGJ64907.1 MAG: cell filamentation protein Fic [Candidatus Peribacteria bacterium RIFCSPHIGHO2_12_FULL_54_10]OGJ67723.1 MAG: cell filamentation protein Fic [Candidatus Peribacteria bacterium RIFCSPLOWO2_01_FULL_54_110]OGJ68903.1 MAG: cell filamentation protein Fic [Candidatus Peribacteria
MKNPSPASPQEPTGAVILYQSGDGSTRIEVRLENETVWLPQKAIAELFQTTPQNITQHIASIYDEAELAEAATCKEFLQVRSEGVREVKRALKCYNLDVILSVGYRIKSKTATQFRIWATQRLREYIVKGFALDDERLKQGGGRARHFEELLQRIRDIRSSERNFYQKVTDIYATSIDYRKDDLLTQRFFATVQNKMHYAVHGHTAAEIIHKRADSSKPMMGLTSFKSRYITAGDVKVAKNYLSEKELKQLNLIVSLYLDFAELQASNERPMKMADWVNKLDEFLKLSEKKLLENAGSISAAMAEEKAETELLKYRKEQDKKYISDFDQAVKK